MGVITATQNHRIKYIKKLAQSSFRRKEGKLVVEGMRLVEEALASTWQMENFFYTTDSVQGERGAQLLEGVIKKGVPYFEVTEAVMAEMADTETPQGVLALLEQPDYLLSDILPPGKPALVVLVDGIQDPGNLGTVIRTADAAGATGVVLLKGTVDLYNPKVIRSTMGSLFHLPVVTGGDINTAVDYLVSAGLELLVGDPSGKLPIFGVDLTRPLVIAVGNEGAGPGTEIYKYTHTKVNIPMPGQAESLNVAVAASIMLYEVIRQRYKIQ